jgi:hypothetical protein
MHITHYMYFDDADSFEAISQYTFPRPGKRLATMSPPTVGKPDGAPT